VIGQSQKFPGRRSIRDVYSKKLIVLLGPGTKHTTELRIRVHIFWLSAEFRKILDPGNMFSSENNQQMML